MFSVFWKEEKNYVIVDSVHLLSDGSYFTLTALSLQSCRVVVASFLLSYSYYYDDWSLRWFAIPRRKVIQPDWTSILLYSLEKASLSQTLSFPSKLSW